MLLHSFNGLLGAVPCPFYRKSDLLPRRSVDGLCSNSSSGSGRCLARESRPIRVPDPQLKESCDETISVCRGHYGRRLRLVWQYGRGRASPRPVLRSTGHRRVFQRGRLLRPVLVRCRLLVGPPWLSQCMAHRAVVLSTVEQPRHVPAQLFHAPARILRNLFTQLLLGLLDLWWLVRRAFWEENKLWLSGRGRLRVGQGLFSAAR